MRIGVRLGIGFAAIIVIMLAVSAFTGNRLSYINQKVKVITEDEYPKTVLLNQVSENINVIARVIRNAVIIEDPAEAKKELDRIPPLSAQTVQCFEKLGKVAHTPEEKAALEEINAARAPYKKAQKEVITLIDAGKKKEAGQLLLDQYRTAQNQYIAALKKMISVQENDLTKAGKAVEDAYWSTRNLSFCFSALACLLGAIFGFLATRSITRPVAQLVAANARLAQGDLTVNIELESRDEVGQLADSSRTVVASMRAILGQVADASQSVAAASRQLQQTAQQIASGTDEMVSEISTVAVASEEMAATSNDIACNCGMAAQSSQSTSSSAGKGSAVVQETIAGMGRIAEQVKASAQTVESLGVRSEQIGEIVGTIEDIADQTNLLALNAAIEAARAGEQGRGFAVVADEVRALAERTTKATREISGMILSIQNETKAAVRAMEEGVAEVERGAASSEKSGEALEEIQSQVNELSLQINQIATAAAEQTATTSEITANVQRASGVVQETARGAGETAAASAQLASSADQLQDLVRRFKLA
ncbi:methyl-accepting chemotaxis protein [Geomonas silvestris]|uniref:Methyl-accepting chemotaxis protein n=1 Tax=Geomonas silvestris TaxID=2740184 RepID=A0A6V8MIQ2_9BACT|nr:methyl-accepting chemotaxis protein [Geomonas silvestris]GFO59559.1 methyl-accepting chemotaxis protein [Geomonas silvestris]